MIYKKLLLCFFLLLIAFYSKSQVFKIDTSHLANDIINNYFIASNHNGIITKNITYNGAKLGLGIFNYKGHFNSLAKNGLILSSGSVIDVYGENKFTSSIENYTQGDVDLSKIAKAKTFDAAILEFDFMSLTDSIHFVFQFASEEYPEYVKKGVSDVFGFFVSDSLSKRNIAIIKDNGIPITVDLINNIQNSEYYVANNYLEYKFKGSKHEDEQFYENKSIFKFDGFTKPITSGLKIEPFKKYHFKIAIADVGDRKFDSWIFLKGNSFISNGTIKNPDIHEIKRYLAYNDMDSIEIFNIKDSSQIFLPVYFDINSYMIKSTAENVLQSILNLLTYSHYNLLINGYADITGSARYNLELSQQRAEQVMKYLINRGISKDRITAVGKGEIAGDQKKQEYRKVEFILY